MEINLEEIMNYEDLKKIQDKSRGRFVLRIIECFKKWRGPDSQAFANQFLSEIFMGQLQSAWAKEQEADKAIQDQLTAAQGQLKNALDTNQTLTDLNAKLTAGGTGSVTTPNGVVLDAADLSTVDMIISKHSVVPTPTPPTP